MIIIVPVARYGKLIFQYWCFFIALVFSTFYGHNALAQQNKKISIYTVNDGLAQNSVGSIAQDKHGFLWLGTEGGASRFDGYTFKNYHHSVKDPHSIIGDKSIRFFLDSKKQFWVITYNGISLYNPADDNFINLLSIEPENVFTADNNFFGEDKQYIYAGICEYGVIRIDKDTHKLSRINIPQVNKVGTANSWYHGFVDGTKLWIVANNNTVVYDLVSGKVQTVDVALNNIISMDNKLALGVNVDGVLFINKQTLKVDADRSIKNGIEQNYGTIFRIADDRAIVASRRGLFYINTNTHKITEQITALGTDNYVVGAISLYIDWSGNLWAGTASNGAFKIEYPFKDFKLFRLKGRNNNINSIYADSSNVYVGNSGLGLNIFSRAGVLKDTINLKRNNPAVANVLLAMFPVAPNKLLMASPGAIPGLPTRLHIFNIQAHTDQLLDNEVFEAYKRYWGQGNFRHFFFRYNDGSLLANAGEYLLTLQPAGSDKFKVSPFHRFTGEMLSTWFIDRDKNLWIGTYKGVYRLHKGVWAKVSIPRQTEVKTISQDNAGNMWLGTNFGIYILDNQLKAVNFYTETNGLINQHLYGLLKDNDGNMWFSTNKGISTYNFKQKAFKHYSHDDGLQSDEFNAIAYFKAADGELFFGGVDGTTSFKPGHITVNQHSPRANFTDILLFDKSYNTEKAYWDTRKLTFGYRDNSLSFEFSLPEYTSPQKNQYAYIMEGVDKRWIKSGTTHFARYPALDAGHYKFKVKASNGDGVWGPPNVIEIDIIPPFWKRDWFIVLATLVCVAVIYITVTLVQRAAYRKKIRAFEIQQRIQFERERISRDLHDNIGTQLSLISKNIKEASSATTDADTARKLNSASQGSSEVIDVLRETIWALNKPQFTLEEFADNLKGFVQKKLAIYTDITINFKDDDGNDAIVLTSTEALNLFRISQEAITNTIKYASAKVIDISILSIKGKFYIAIADNGVGFSPEEVSRKLHYGLENMRYRASEIKCDFKIESHNGGGTTISIAKK